MVDAGSEFWLGATAGSGPARTAHSARRAPSRRALCHDTSPAVPPVSSPAVPLR